MKKHGRRASHIANRFWSKVDKNGPVPAHAPELGPCWIWTGHITADGYGDMEIGSRSDGSRHKEGIHRIAWYLAHGQWPEPCALHRCDNRACGRVDHLFEGTNADNIADRNSKGRQSRGERHATAKLTNAQAMDVIRKKAGGATTRELAREFGVSKTAIAAVGRANWLHLATPGQRQRMDRYVRRRGADHGNAKITEEQAKEIIRRKANGEPKARLARLFGISAQQVSRVGTVSWTHLVTATR